MTTAPDTSDIDLDELMSTEREPDMDYWGHSSATRAATWKKFRDERPIAFMPEFPYQDFPAGPGYWNVTRFDDVMHVSRHPDIFCSGQGTNIFDLPVEVSEFMGSMINMDSPRHTHLRKIVNKAFTPRMVARIDEDVRIKAREIVAHAAEHGPGDFVELLACPLPLQIICEMMGIPRELWSRILAATNTILGDDTTTPDLATLMGEVMSMAQIAREVGEDRLANPQDDLVSAMMHAEVDGKRLQPMEMASFFILLAAAGNETTRNAISHGTRTLQDHPDQRAALLADYDEMAPAAVEEIVRWATPVIHFRRTATQDTMIGDQPIAEGDKVVMWYESANRDERHFDDPYTFDIRRNPNDHVGFGAGGPHFCLGANLARREIRVMLEEIYRWLPDIEVGEPDYLRSPFIHGVKHMPCTFSPPKEAIPAAG
jgi:cytochrome P450